MPTVPGTQGTVKIGTSPNQKTFTKVSSWEYTAEFDTTDSGPFVGDPVITEVIAGEKGELSIEGEMPVGSDDAVDALVAAKGTLVDFQIATTEGMTLDWKVQSGSTQALVKSVSVKAESDGVQAWSATLTGQAKFTVPT